MSTPSREAGVGPHRPFEPVSAIHLIARMSTYTLPSTMIPDCQHLCLPPTLGLLCPVSLLTFSIPSKHVTNSLLLVLPLLSVRQLVSFARSRQSAMEFSEPLSAAHKTPASAGFESRGHFSTQRNQLCFDKNQPALLKLSPPVQLFLSIDCNGSKMSNTYQRNPVSVYDLIFRKPDTHLVNVVLVE